MPCKTKLYSSKGMYSVMEAMVDIGLVKLILGCVNLYTEVCSRVEALVEISMLKLIQGCVNLYKYIRSNYKGLSPAFHISGCAGT